MEYNIETRGRGIIMEIKKALPFSGIISISGETDTGKSTFIFNCGISPSRIAFIDDDIKGSNVAKALKEQGDPLGYYCDLRDKAAGMKEQAFHRYCLSIIDELEKRKDTIDVIGWDTWSGFEATFQPWVAGHMKDFREKWSHKGDIKGAEIWKESFRYEGDILNRLSKIARVVILTSHMKNDYHYPGKRIPDFKNPVIQTSVLSAILTHSPDGPEPQAILLKRIPSIKVNDNGVITSSPVLPRKVKEFTWDTIRKYWKNPIGFRKPTLEETPNEQELSMIDSSVITEEQKLAMQLELKNREQENMTTEEIIISRYEKGEKISDIAKDMGMKVPEVIKFIKEK